MKLFAPRTFILTVLLAGGLGAQPASADIYWFTDESGVVHFSNVPTNKRYVPFTAVNGCCQENNYQYARQAVDTPAKIQ